MRYLRKYNENFTDMTDPNLMKLQNEFRDFANDCLAYLVDEGFIISVAVRNTYDGCLLEFNLVRNETDPKKEKMYNIDFAWNSIKDDFIPFLELVKEKFIVDHIVKFTTNKITTLNIDVVINDDINVSGGSILRDDNIRNISFFIKDYR
jgi:hypothetical protein